MFIENIEYKKGLIEVSYYPEEELKKPYPHQPKKSTKKEIKTIILNPSKDKILSSSFSKFFYHVETKNIYWWNAENDADHHDLFNVFFSPEFGYNWDEQFYKGCWFFSDETAKLDIHKHGKTEEINGEYHTESVDVPEVKEELLNFYKIKLKEKRRWPY